MKGRKRRISVILLTWMMAISFGIYLGMEQGTAAESKLLEGGDWVKMSLEGKRAFVVGVGEMADIEEEMIHRHPELRRDSFSEKLAEVLGDVPVDTVVNQIDSFYKRHPDKLDVPVMRVVWDEMIKPKVSTIAGKPIKK